MVDCRLACGSRDRGQVRVNGGSGLSPHGAWWLVAIALARVALDSPDGGGKGRSGRGSGAWLTIAPVERFRCHFVHCGVRNDRFFANRVRADP